MSKKFQIILGVIAVVAVAGYSAFWWGQTQLARRTVEQKITELNSFAAPMNQNKPLLTYERIDVSGFPGASVITLVNPHADLPVSALLKTLLGPKAQTSDAVWTERMDYKGPIVLTGSLFTNRYSIEFHDGANTTSRVNGETIFSMDATVSKPLRCEVSFAGTALGFSHRALSSESEGDMWKNLFRSLHCSLPEGMQAVDAASKAMFFASGPLDITFAANAPHDSVRDFHFLVDSPSTQYGPAYDTFIRKLEPLTGLHLSGVLPIPKSAMGVTSMKIDMDVLGVPDTLQSGPKGTLPFVLDVRALDVKNAFGEFTNRWHVKNTVSGEQQRSLVVKGESRNRSDPAFDEAVQQYAPQTMQMILEDTQGPGGRNLTDYFASLSEDERTILLENGIPRLSRFGTWRVAVDTELATTKAAAGSPAQGAMAQLATSDFTLQLAGFALGCDLYGLNLKGTMQRTPMQADFVLGLHAFDRFVDDVVAYGRGIEPLLVKSVPRAPLYLDNQPLIDGLKTFIAAISVPDETQADMRTIHIQSTGAMPIISGKALPEVMGLAQTHILVHLPRPDAPAAESEPSEGEESGESEAE